MKRILKGRTRASRRVIVGAGLPTPLLPVEVPADAKLFVNCINPETSERCHVSQCFKRCSQAPA